MPTTALAGDDLSLKLAAFVTSEKVQMKSESDPSGRRGNKLSFFEDLYLQAVLASDFFLNDNEISARD